MAKKDVELSKFMSLVLRHAPEQASLALDDNGWASFPVLCRVLHERFGATADDVRRVVEESPKKRFSLDGDRIRAVQGHSIDVDLQLVPAMPPKNLFHGTKADFLDSIMTAGLQKQSRQFVHLSSDEETARTVAVRRAGPNAILTVASGAMFDEGFVFHHSENGVWLTDNVPSRFLSIMEGSYAP